jgi:hypothetical protein
MSDGPSPEAASRAHNIVADLQARMAKQDTKASSADTRRERVEQTASPDARKTRALIRKGYTSLPVLAKDLIPVVSDLAARHDLEQALDGFMEASAEYFRAEGKPVAVIDWLGGSNGQVATPTGAYVPQHKTDLMATWHRLLRAVNELSKVGIVKQPKPLMQSEPTRIELLVDLDETAPVVGPSRWD